MQSLLYLVVDESCRRLSQTDISIANTEVKALRRMELV